MILEIDKSLVEYEQEWLDVYQKGNHLAILVLISNYSGNGVFEDERLYIVYKKF